MPILVSVNTNDCTCDQRIVLIGQSSLLQLRQKGLMENHLSVYIKEASKFTLDRRVRYKGQALFRYVDHARIRDIALFLLS